MLNRLPILLLLIVTQPISPMQQQSTQSILSQSVAAFQKEEPSWTFIAAICNCILVDEEKSKSVGTWLFQGPRGREVADVTVYEIASAEGAARWLQNFSSK